MNSIGSAVRLVLRTTYHSAKVFCNVCQLLSCLVHGARSRHTTILVPKHS